MILKNVKYALQVVSKSSPLYIFCQIVISLFSVLAPVIDVIAPAYIIDMLVKGKPVLEIFWFIAIVVGLELIRGVIVTFFTSWLFPPMQERIKARINTLLIQKFQNIDYINLEIPDYYDRVELSFNQADKGFLNVVDSFFFWVNALLYLTSLIAVVSMLEPFLVIIAILTSCVILISQLLCAKIAYKYEKVLIKAERKQNYFKNVFYKYSFFKDIKIYDCHSFFSDQYIKVADRKENIVRNKSWQIATINLLSTILKIMFLLAGAMLYIVYKIHVGALEIASFIALYTATIQSANQLIELVNASTQLYKDGLYVNNFRTLYETEPEIEHSGGCECVFEKKIKISNLSFGYIGSEKFVLKNVSMEIGKGEKIAIVGANGGGKSTLAKLLLRLYEPNIGGISIDDIDIKNMDIVSLRKKISYMPQELNVYSMSIAENILMRKCESAEDEATVFELIKMVGLDEKIRELPNGIYTILSKEYDENGTLFSGGEMQKIALARAMHKPAEILIMDEPSSAMDPLSTNNFLENMLLLAKNKTVIIITHQLLLTKFVDKIYCFDNGELIEKGNHHELIENEGLYKKMYQAQGVWYE